jgi:hypothetical protein
VLNPIYQFIETGEDANHKIIGSLQRTENKMVNTQKFLSAGLSDVV